MHNVDLYIHVEFGSCASDECETQSDRQRLFVNIGEVTLALAATARHYERMFYKVSRITETIGIFLDRRPSIKRRIFGIYLITL